MLIEPVIPAISTLKQEVLPLHGSVRTPCTLPLDPLLCLEGNLWYVCRHSPGRNPSFLDQSFVCLYYRGAPRVPDVRHGLPEPVIPHGLPPDHVPRVPAVRPNMPGPSHLRPRINVPGYMPVMHAAIPAPAVPHIPPVPTMVRPALPRHPAFGAPVFDPLHPVDVSRSLTPPMSEREFYKMQKKLKSR